MCSKLVLAFLAQSLGILLLGQICKASSFGVGVTVVPMEGNLTAVRAHYSVISALPCPSLTDVCANSEDCEVYNTALPYTGTQPLGWCVRQWQKTIPGNYMASLTLGSNVDVFLSVKAEPVVRAYSGKLNQPPYCGLLPPMRARVNCPHHFHLSVKDLDGDKVHCRFARADLEECLNCSPHSFLELHEAACMLAFNGEASAGQYSIALMIEDFLPVPTSSYSAVRKALSSVPVYLSLTVEDASSSCSAEPIATGETPRGDATFHVLPYEQISVTVTFLSALEKVSEIVVAGPPDMFRLAQTTTGDLSTITLSWIRKQNKLPPLLPICFMANTNSLQSEPRCIWLYQKQTKTLPAGTELKCDDTEMTLVLPLSSLNDIKPSELQLNSVSCPVAYNDTHLTARISLNGCGTKKVHAGVELVYTNTLQTVRPYSVVSRLPSLFLPLACSFGRLEAKGPHDKIVIPQEKEIFGEFNFYMEFYFPGQGPFAKFTRNPEFRVFNPELRRTKLEEPVRIIGSQVDYLDLHVFANCSLDRAELIVTECKESETEDFTKTNPLVTPGCNTGSGSLEVITSNSTVKVYRLDLRNISSAGSTMYVECSVSLCIATLPSQKCQNFCEKSSYNRLMVNNVLTANYTIRSGPVSLVVTTPAPTNTVAPTTAAITTTTINPTEIACNISNRACIILAHSTTSSKAPDRNLAWIMGVFFTGIHVIQHILLR